MQKILHTVVLNNKTSASKMIKKLSKLFLSLSQITEESNVF